jgi:hypothetical protein
MLVPSRSARRIGLLVGGSNSDALTDADFRGCRWIEGEPKPLWGGMFCGRPVLAGESWGGMFCGRPVLAGESWCAMHRDVVFGEELRR